MRLLHLSDLHDTLDGDEVEPVSIVDVWESAIAPIRRRGPYDVIIASGDLSQRAGRGEYERLLGFCNRNLLPLLRAPNDRSRIVFVPGNHDVDWTVPVGQDTPPWRLAHEKGGIAGHVQRWRDSPAKCDYRIVVESTGHVRSVRLFEPAERAKRFAEVQRFLEEFYSDALEQQGGRRFELLREHAGGDWSAHLLHDQRVALCGFNSCHGNDRFWTGALVSAQAVSRCRELLDERAPDYLRVAIWHHGLTGEVHRPDLLSPLSIRRLYDAGFRLGMHGHTHEAAVGINDDLFPERFAVVSTGSLGAGSRERPAAAGNQFSVLDLYRQHLRVEVFDKPAPSRAFQQLSMRHVVFASPEHHRERRTHVAEHLRTVELAANGVATTVVELRKVELEEPLVLAVLTPPFCSVHHEQWALANGNRKIPVTREQLPDGRLRFELAEVPGRQARSYERLTWRYHVSNAFAMHNAELDWRRSVSEWFPHLHPGETGRPYTVRFLTGRLRLTFRLLDEAFAPLEAGLDQFMHADEARVHVEDDHGTDLVAHKRWSPVDGEQITSQVAGNELQFEIQGPRVGRRYTPVYRLRKRVDSLPEDAVELAKRLLQVCRGTGANTFPRADLPEAISSVVANKITESCSTVLPHLLGGDFDGEWIGFLWSQQQRELQAAFGRFPPRIWAARFPCGSGVAGHAFRFGEIAVWHSHWDSSDDPRRSLLYQVNPGHAHEWLVCVPLRVTFDAPAVGVICLHGRRVEGPAAAKLAAFARARESGRGERAQLGKQLLWQLNAAFWDAVRFLDIPEYWSDLQVLRTAVQAWAPPD